MKRAELFAQFALVSAAAITAQRTFRGYMGKLKSSEMRAEMAEFISMIRMEDSLNDEVRALTTAIEQSRDSRPSCVFFYAPLPSVNCRAAFCCFKYRRSTGESTRGSVSSATSRPLPLRCKRWPRERSLPQRTTTNKHANGKRLFEDRGQSDRATEQRERKMVSLSLSLSFGPVVRRYRNWQLHTDPPHIFIISLRINGLRDS